MKSFFSINLIFLLWFTTVYSQRDNNYENIYHTPLGNIKDCKVFASQKVFNVAKCDAYYRNGKFFLDGDYRIEFAQCLNNFKDTLDFTPAIFYTLHGLVGEVSKNQGSAISALYNEYAVYVTLLPQVMYFLGPQGNSKEIVTNVDNIGGLVALSVSERETTSVRYSNDFFKSMSKVKALEGQAIKFLVLNGFHMYNVKDRPPLDPAVLTSVSGIILRVDPKNAHKLGKQTLVNHVRSFGYRKTIFLDMPGAPQFGGAGELLLTPITAILCFMLLELF